MKHRIGLRLPILAALGCMTTMAACPMSVDRSPDLEVLVVDDAGNPIPNARVVLLAAEDPHSRFIASEEATTGPDGKVAWKHKSETVQGCFCLPHGVPFRYFEVCADLPGHVPVKADVGLGNQLRLELKASPGEARRCEADGSDGHIMIRAPGASASASSSAAPPASSP